MSIGTLAGLGHKCHIPGLRFPFLLSSFSWLHSSGLDDKNSPGRWWESKTYRFLSMICSPRYMGLNVEVFLRTLMLHRHWNTCACTFRGSVSHGGSWVSSTTPYLASLIDYQLWFSHPPYCTKISVHQGTRLLHRTSGRYSTQLYLALSKPWKRTGGCHRWSLWAHKKSWHPDHQVQGAVSWLELS